MSAQPASRSVLGVRWPYARSPTTAPSGSPSTSVRSAERAVSIFVRPVPSSAFIEPDASTMRRTGARPRGAASASGGRDGAPSGDDASAEAVASVGAVVASSGAAVAPGDGRGAVVAARAGTRRDGTARAPSSTRTGSARRITR